MSEATPMTRDQISAAIAEKAWKDEAFHRAVLTNPNKVYEEQTGQSLPPGMSIKVLEDTPTTVHFVIPAKPAQSSELSDAELENVAGGISPTFIAVSAATLFSAQIAGSMAVEGKKQGW